VRVGHAGWLLLFTRADGFRDSVKVRIGQRRWIKRPATPRLPKTYLTPRPDRTPRPKVFGGSW
jgi:hypothetical protein